MAKQTTESKEVAKVAGGALPTYMQPKTSSVGNVDASDRIIPRLKLLQGISPECEQFEKARSGQFWHTLLEDSLGKELDMVPILIRKSIALWAPRGDQRGVLARSNDCVTWDVKDKFEVNLKNGGKQVWDTTSGSVNESQLAKFGSSIKGDPNSQPAAALTYNIIVFLPQHAALGPMMIINTRSAVKPAKGLISKIDMRPVDHYGQVFTLGVMQDKGAEGPYNNYTYGANGYAEEDVYNRCRDYYEQFKDIDVRSNDEGDESSEGGGGKGEAGTVGGAKGKF